MAKLPAEPRTDSVRSIIEYGIAYHRMENLAQAPFPVYIPGRPAQRRSTNQEWVGNGFETIHVMRLVTTAGVV